VATNVGGTSEAMDVGLTGLLVPPGNAAAMAESILNIARNPVLARRMGEAGRQRVEDRFDVRTMVARYEAMYAEVVHHRARLAA
jgi:glycosyltransferase involved in cell wall biosynthesis